MTTFKLAWSAFIIAAVNSASPFSQAQQPQASSSSSRAGVDFPGEYRSIDGTGNNRRNPDWGAAESALLRLSTIGYDDGISTPSESGRPGARAISNALNAQAGSVPNQLGLSDMVWQWGQFLDHDLDQTPLADPAEPLPIAVPSGDGFFDPDGTGTQIIPLSRSFFEIHGGVREQVNVITAYIDASNLYGSDEERASALRTHEGGRLKTSSGNLLPYNTDGLPNDEPPPLPSSEYFLAGDERCNEQVGLTCMHTLFVREHNFWAKIIEESDPYLSDEEIYQMARVIVAAEMQVITYKEFIPALLGQDALHPYRGYDRRVHPGISNIFATAAFRVGHTMLSPTLRRLNRKGNTISGGDLALADAFFSPAKVAKYGIDPVLRGLAYQPCQEIDLMVVDGVRNFLFGAPGKGGFDLVSLNIQRGRDHGLPTYNELRADAGLQPCADFSDINAEYSVIRELASVYDSVDDIDAWIGMLAERHVPGAAVGETLRIVLQDQFERLRDGDRFWYERYLPASLRRIVERQTLSRICRRNTGIGSELRGSVFRARQP